MSSMSYEGASSNASNSSGHFDAKKDSRRSNHDNEAMATATTEGKLAQNWRTRV
jgi:hypothetical protein